MKTQSDGTNGFELVRSTWDLMNWVLEITDCHLFDTDFNWVRDLTGNLVRTSEKMRSSGRSTVLGSIDGVRKLNFWDSLFLLLFFNLFRLDILFLGLPWIISGDLGFG
uniref:Uncharacterized protein n=1 Tax=Opuntia streptacantha TaxID=393608 RepID=A0A7C9EBN0_OPUST